MQTDFQAPSSMISTSFRDRKLFDNGGELNYSTGFENVDNISLKDSHEFSVMRSVDLGKSFENCSAPQENECDESLLDKLRIFGTNVKYRVGSISQKNLQEYPIHMLGRTYETLEDFYEHFQSIIWCTYRRNFPRLLSKHKDFNEIYTNDTSWGCMIRASQMMFSEVLTRNRLTPHQNLTELQDQVISTLLEGEEFADNAPYSIHSIIQHLYDNMHIKPGQWFKASQILLSFEAVHKQRRGELADDLECTIFLEGTIYLDQILDKVCPEPKNEFENISDLEEMKEDLDARFNKPEIEKTGSNECEDEEAEDTTPKKPTQRSENDLDTEEFHDSTPKNNYDDEDDKVSNFSSNSEDVTEEARAKFKAQMKAAWCRSIFFVVLAKVGLDEINAEYIPCIKELLEYPQSVGMIGGRPGNAYYFVGYQNDDLIYLDPHFVQESCLTKADVRTSKQTYFCNQPRTIHISKIDTSIAIGFYIKDAKDFENFMQRIQKTSKKASAFFGLEKYSPIFDEIGDDNMSFSDHEEGNGKDGDYFVI